MCEQPCYHLNLRVEEKVRETWPSPGYIVTRTAWCDRCDEIVYEERKDHLNGTWSYTYTDAVYELLFTPRGRMELAREALRARGWEPPEVWERGALTQPQCTACAERKKG